MGVQELIDHPAGLHWGQMATCLGLMICECGWPFYF